MSTDSVAQDQVTAARAAAQKNGPRPEGAPRSNTHMLDKPSQPDQQGVRDFITEGNAALTAVEMHRILENCQYEHQRPISDRHVDVLSDLMRRDRWQPKSQIDFAVLNGRYILVNGYHRAYAQVKSGKKIVWNIALHKVVNQEELRALYYAFDTNVRTRTAQSILAATEFGDVTGITGDMAKSLFNAVPWIAAKFSWVAQDRNYLVDKQVDLRISLAQEYAKAARNFQAAISGAPGKRRIKFRSGGVTAVAVATFRYQPEAAWKFWSGVAGMDGLKRGDPRLALASDFMTRKVVGGSNPAAIAPSILAWNAFFDDRPMQIIKVLDTFRPIIDGTPFDGKTVKVA